jgi:hypothetical protein
MGLAQSLADEGQHEVFVNLLKIVIRGARGVNFCENESERPETSFG